MSRIGPPVHARRRTPAPILVVLPTTARTCRGYEEMAGTSFLARLRHRPTRHARRRLPGASLPGVLPTVAASSLHAGHHVRILRSTVKTDAAQYVWRSAIDHNRHFYRIPLVVQRGCRLGPTRHARRLFLAQVSRGSHSRRSLVPSRRKSLSDASLNRSRGLRAAPFGKTDAAQDVWSIDGRRRRRASQLERRRYSAMSPAVDTSCGRASSGFSSSRAIAVASALPSSTPH